MKRITILLTSALIFSITMSGCSSLGLNLNNDSTRSGSASHTTNGTRINSSPSAANTMTDEDNDSDDELDATVAKTIDTNGTHTITGTVDGQILVTAENVTLILDGATINCTDGSAILGKDGNGTDILQNLTVELRGKNTVTSSKHGIQGKDNLTVTGSGSVTISSGKDGLHAGDTLTVKSGTLDITATSDGIEVGNAANGTGTLNLEGGNVTIIAGGIFNIDSLDDSIHANGNISITNGTFTILSGDDGIHADGDLTISSGEINVKKSYEALEGNNVYISGGTMDLNSSDDGINAAGGSSNGTDGGFGQFGGDRFRDENATRGSSNGTDGGPGQFGGDRFRDENTDGGSSNGTDGGFGQIDGDRFRGGGDNTIDINGGTIKLYAGGDGIDSNGTINISGGTVTAIINSTPDNSALDSDGETTVTGGTVIAGGTGTFENISSNSIQSYVYLTDVSSGAEIIIKSSGETLAFYTADKEISYLTIFAHGIISGNSYDVSVGDNNLSITAGIGGGRNMGGVPGGNPGGRQQFR